MDTNVFMKWLVLLMLAVGLAACVDEAEAPSKENVTAAQADTNVIPTSDGAIEACSNDGDCQRGSHCSIPDGSKTGACVPPVVGSGRDMGAPNGSADASDDGGTDASADAATDGGSDAAPDAHNVIVGSGMCSVIVSYAAGTMKFSTGAGCDQPVRGVLAYDPLGHTVDWDQAQQRPVARQMLALAADGTVALPQYLAAVVPVASADCDPDRDCTWVLNGLMLGVRTARCQGNDFRHAAFDFLLAVGHDPGRDACPASQP